MSDWQPGATITGPYLVARNSATTGIHTDAFARSQGFERAVVAGPNHLVFASTLIEEQLGAAWLERGRLTARFTAPVYDGDQARAVIAVENVGEAFAASFQIENGDAVVCARGTAGWVRGDAPLPTPPPSSPEDDLLDLRALHDGEAIPAESVVAASEEVERFCRQNHDHLARPGRLPTPYLSPLLFAPARRLMNERGVGPGMWGEIEIRQHRPLRTDTPYRYEGTVRARRRRGTLEIVDFVFAAREQSGALICEIAHSHLIPHREARA